MKVAVDVKNRDEANAVKAAMADPRTKSLILILGTLQQLPSDDERRKVLQCVKTVFESEEPPHANRQP